MLIQTIDVMGSLAFKPVKSDMAGNIKVGYVVVLCVFYVCFLSLQVR